MAAAPTDNSIAVVVVTYNRLAVLDRTLDALLAQTFPFAKIYVVDNASTDGTVGHLRATRPEVEVLEMSDNLGYGAGLARGIEQAFASGYEWFWLMDDDSRPHPETLARLVEATRYGSAEMMVGFGAGRVRFGYPYRVEASELPAAGPGVYRADHTLVDGTLVSRPAVAAIGVPRADLFIMMEDFEYTYRARRAGVDVLVLPDDLLERGFLGSTDAKPGATMWRTYYQTRNHVRVALESGSLTLLLGCIARQSRFLVGSFFAPTLRRRRVLVRLAGIRDGILGRMGKTFPVGGSS